MFEAEQNLDNQDFAENGNADGQSRTRSMSNRNRACKRLNVPEKKTMALLKLGPKDWSVIDISETV